MSLLVSGWLALDEIKTPFGEVEGSLGGSATFAVLAASLFTDVRLLAVIGNDFPKHELRKLEGRRIDMKGVVTAEGETSRWGASYHQDMNERDTLYTVLGVNESWEPKLPTGWSDSRTAFMAAGHPTVQRNVLSMLDDPRSTVVDTIKLFIDNDRDELQKTMRAADYIAINDGEARELAGKATVASAAAALLGQGVRSAIIKLGEYGAMLKSANDHFVAAGYPLDEVVDPTGAGDAFAGGFSGYLDAAESIDTKTVRQAMIYASAVASFTVEGFGPSRLLEVTPEEVDIRYREFRELTHFEVDDRG